MRAPNRRREPGSDELAWLFGGGLLLALFALLCTAWAAARWASPTTAADPFTYGAGYLSGRSIWPPGALGRFLVLLLPVLALLAILGLLLVRSQRGRSRTDDRASSMAAARDLRELEEPAMRKDAARLATGSKSCGSPLRDSATKGDAYFDGAGKNLLSCLLLAASVAGASIKQVYTWLTDPENLDPVKRLRAAGHDLPAEALEGAIRLTPKQRDGVFGTALEMAGFLRNAQVLPWVTPQGASDSRPQLDPAAFVRSRQTLYLISREGRGSARALTAALTVAVVEAAEDFAATQARGRLAIPLTYVLDEAANVCRWPELPDLYSHYGSRGIVMSTFLQSWSQGVQVWGREGMDKLWSAANNRGVGSGVGEPEFLDRVSRLVGDHDVLTRDQSRSRSGRSVSLRNRRERILDTADLAALPLGRAVVFVSGLPAALVKLVHWSAAPYAQNVRASEEHYGSIASKRPS